MQRVSAVLGSALFFLVAPCVLAGLIPWSMTRWEFGLAFFGLEGARSVGVLLILVGLPGLVDSFARFALQGLGTPAPVAPTKNLVVTGLYRHVRNPIYLAVVAIILGQAMLFGDWRLVLLGALFWLAFHLFVVAYEEPTLRRTFGSEYEAYRANVPAGFRGWSPGEHRSLVGDSPQRNEVGRLCSLRQISASLGSPRLENAQWKCAPMGPATDHQYR